MVNKKQKPRNKQRSNKRSNIEKVEAGMKPTKKYGSKNRQDAEEDIEKGLDSWEHGEEY